MKQWDEADQGFGASNRVIASKVRFSFPFSCFSPCPPWFIFKH